MRSFKISVVRILTVLVAMLMLGTSTFAQVSVTLPSVSGTAGTTGAGAITVGDLTGKNVTAFQFSITYDKSILYITGATTDNTIASGVAPTVNADTANGKISVAWASATALTGSGSLINLQFTFRKVGVNALNFDPSSFMFNAGNPTATVTAGSVTVPQILIQGGTVNGRVGQTILIPIMVSAISDAQNVRSYDFVASFDKSVININNASLDGTLSATGTPAINVDNTAGTVRFAWAGSDRIITSGGSVLVYLTATAVGVGTTNLNFTSFEFNTGNPIAGASSASVTVTEQNYAPTLTLNPVGPNYSITDGTQLKITLVGADQNAADVATLAYSVTSPATLPAGAALVANVFTWTPTVAQRSATPYSFTFQVKDTAGASSSVTVSVTVAQNVPPTLTLSPANTTYTIGEGSTLTVTLNGADANPSDVPLLKYSVTTPATLPAGAKLTGNVFTWTPSYDASSTTPYSFTFQVADQSNATATASISVTVTNTDRAPVFTSVPNYVVVPVTIPDPTVYKFQFVATDPDAGDQVVYSLISGPAGSSVDIYGLFSWGPTPAQAGQVFTITVQASDGTLSTTTTQLIAASATIVDVKENEIPTEFSLQQNYPNPFNPTTSIEFGLPKDSHVRLSVYNILGQEVNVLVNRNMSAGMHKVNFDASKLNSGMYIYRIEADKFVSVRKMLLLK